MKNTTIRADKLLSSLGLASRRGIETYLKTNSVTADGTRITEHGQRVNMRANIKVNGRELKKPHKVYFLLNKPKGVVSTASDEFGRKNVVSLIKTNERIFPIGRLDRDTHGVLILTNDGELTNMLIHPKYHVAKIYQLIIKGPVNPPQIEKLEKGVVLEDGVTQPAKVNIIQRRKDATVMELTIFEGKKRQIRRMCEALNLPLADLERIRFGNITAGELQQGEYRELSGKEVEKLKELTKK
jgi:23S rRNA pseudouridine2605 synthase